MYQDSITRELLSALPEENQIEVIEDWFRGEFEDPVQSTPYDSAEGGYIWIWGGPCDALEELYDEFEGTVPYEAIKRLAAELDAECSEWAPIPDEDDYDHTFYEVISSNIARFENFNLSIEVIEELLAQELIGRPQQALFRLLYANVVTALETYLSDTFINAVDRDRTLLRKFVETNPDFKHRSLKLSDLFNAADQIDDEVKKYLLDVIWHNLVKVRAMYINVLDINFGKEFPVDVARAISTRHDIVHRNGRTKTGSEVSVTREDIETLIIRVRSMITHIETEYKKIDWTEPESEDLSVEF